MPFDAFFSALQGEDRVAGVVIEYDRVRYAEFRAARKGEQSHAGRVLVSEGAVSLPEGAIRAGALAKPEALVEALKKLRKEGKPRPLATPQVVLGIPVVRLVGATVEVPRGVGANEAEGALRLEIESTLPFPVEEAYLDWQPVNSSTGEKQFLYAGARITEIEPYIHAAEEAGMGVVAVEPVTLSMARGMEASGKVTYIANVYPDALLGAAVNEQGEARYFHHRSIPVISSSSGTSLGSAKNDGRTQRLMLELAAFIRFLRDQFQGREQELVVDGNLSDDEVQQMQNLADSLGIKIHIDLRSHALSRAATRGVAMRGMMPRSTDTYMSLMAHTTEVAYAQKQAAFFFSMALKTLIAGAVFTTLVMAGAWGLMFKLEQDAKAAAATQQTAIPAAALQTLEEAQAINLALSDAVSLLQPAPLPEGIMEALDEVSRLGITIDRVTMRAEEGVVKLDLALVARDGTALKNAQNVLREKFAAAADEVDVDASLLVSGRTNIPFAFSFTLAEGALENTNNTDAR